MPGEVTLEDVEYILTNESNFLSSCLDGMFNGNLCATKQKVRESRQRLTKALEMLDNLIQERELSAMSESRQ